MKNSLSLFVLLVFLSCFQVQANRYYVTQGGSGNQTGVSWVDASDNLINIMSGIQMNDEIWVAAGNYFPSLTNTRTDFLNISAANVKIFGGFSGSESMVEQRDHVANPTIVSGNIGTGSDTDNSQTIFQVRG